MCAFSIFHAIYLEFSEIETTFPKFVTSIGYNIYFRQVIREFHISKSFCTQENCQMSSRSFNVKFRRGQLQFGLFFSGLQLSFLEIVGRSRRAVGTNEAKSSVIIFSPDTNLRFNVMGQRTVFNTNAILKIFRPSVERSKCQIYFCVLTGTLLSKIHFKFTINIVRIFTHFEPHRIIY